MPDSDEPGMGHDVSDLPPEDHLEAQRWRDYRRGRRYSVLTHSPFERVRPGSPLVLRTMVCADSGDLLDGGTRPPEFVTEADWMELRIAEQVARAAPLVQEWMTLAEIAEVVRVSERTIRRHVDRGELPFTKFGRQRKVRRSDFEEWCKKDIPATREIREADAYRRGDF